jgi:hypothetical protein
MANDLKFLKGMIKDTGQMDQIDGTYRDALNLIVDDLRGNVANEYGTVNIGNLNISGIALPGGGTETVAMDPIGQVALLDDNFIIFSAGSFNATVGVILVSAIHKINVANNTSQVLYYTLDRDLTTGQVNPLGHLNFDTRHPITAELRLSPSQEQIVYFTDNKHTFIHDPATDIEYVSEYNPPRVFNVTKQEESLISSSDTTNLYGNFSRTDFLNLFMDAGRIPEFGDISILKGGGVVTGAYYLGVAYADDDKTETNVLTVSNPVYIVPSNDDTIPRETISGAPNNTQTSKSVLWRLTNVNTEYKYIIPYVIQYSGKARFVYKLEAVNIRNTNANIVYSGLEKVASSAIEEAVIDKVRYLSAKSITQLDNKMYAANLRSRPDLGYQRFANSIVVEPVVEEIDPFDPRRYDVYILNEGYAQLVYPDPPTGNFPVHSGGANNYPIGTFGTIPYIHLEGVDGITDSYVTNVIAPIQNGTSAGYRDPNLLFSRKSYRRGEVYAFYISFVLKDGSESFAYHIPGRRILDRFETDWTFFPNLGANNYAINNGEILAYDSNSLPYQYYDTSYMENIPLSSNMGYWENQNEFYPQGTDFETWTVGSNGQGVFVSDASNAQNIRHHKMPSNHNNRYSHVVRDTYFGDPDISEPDSIYITQAGARVFRDRVRILGIQLRNLKIPKFILNQVQGYKVYYAKRTQGNKTIIGQSGAHPATSYLAANIINTNRNAGIGPFFNIWSLDGHLKYGGLAVSDALWVPPPSVVDFINFTGSGATNYIGNPVLKFHDFNLLRKKHTLATATHVDVQYIVLMENWRGGYKGTLSSQIPDATGLNIINRYYRAFRSGVGDDTYSWVHPDLGNMINFDASNENDLYWDLAGPRLLWGNVYVASRYSTPGASSDSTGNLIDIGTLWVDNMNQFRYLGGINGVPNLCTNQRAILSNTQTIFMLEPDGATYINGLSVLKSTSANSFKSSTYINNSFGESGIVLGLASGLPMLGGYRSNQWSYVGLGNLMWSLPIYGASGNLALIGGIDPDFYPAYNVNNGANEFVYDMALWYEMMSRGHSSLKQPYPIPTPAGDNATPIASLTATVTAGDPIVIITGIASGSGDMLDLFEGMIVTSSGGVFPNEAVVTLLQINPTSATTGSIILSEPPLVSGVRTLSFRPIGGVAGSIVNDQRTRPNVYLINLCSSKTDVFEPFDQQQLVWTGYYKSLLNVDLETGADSEDGNIYYGEGDTAQSGDIYGGDTYICKYSYRTTSNLYGLGRFVRGVNRYLPYYNLPSIYDDYLFGDVPIDNLEGITPSFGTNIFGVIADYNVLWMGGASPQPNGGGDMNSGPRRGAITISNNWSKNGGTAFSTIYQFIVESDDNINYRHAGDPEAGVSELNSMYFDKYTAADVLWRSPLGDLTKMDNILYEDHYSAQQDIRVTIPFPKEGNTTTSFPNRVIRSSTQDGNFNDTYRYFLGLQYKDFAVNKGQITNIFNLKALLYIHTEKSLFRTKGKQNLELSDATQAYIGSGDLFAQEPDEFIQSVEGYNGLYNKMGTLVTKDGYIFVARKSRKIFLVKDEIVDLTQLGMNSWARENIPFSLEAYGWDPDYTGVITDAPTADFGFLISYDPLFKRTIITKRELSPTQFFIDQFRQGLINYSLDKGVFEDVLTGDTLPIERGAYFEKSGWTISFSNSLSIWASRHSYIPPLYAYNSQNLYSFDKVLIPFQGMFSYMYEHSDLTSPGTFYERTYNFEIDCIFTSPLNALYSSFKYTANVFSKLNYSLPVQQEFNPGFTSFYVYNTTQMSGEVRLVYLNNIRKTDSNWNVNAFRDLSAVEVNSSLSVGQVDVQGNIYNTSTTIISSEPMFTSEGIINPNYINSNKPWYEQRKFVDKFLGIRLISNNLSRNLINLYTVSVASRISPR